MREKRLRALLVGHALSEDEPVGVVLRGVGAWAAAEESESGSLSGCLSSLDFPADLCVLAESHPAALHPAQVRLSRLPSSLQYRLPMYQVLAYLVLIGLLQVLSVSLSISHLPVFLEMVTEMSGQSRSSAPLQVAGVLVFIVVVVLPALVLLWDRLGRWGWAGHLHRARQASLAAALVESGASPGVLQSFSPHLGRLEALGASAAELDLVASRAVARADQSHASQVNLVRVLGLGLLLLSAGLITMVLYGNMALLGVSI